ncbi:hypothetical protein JAF94_003533 [Citrobacter braakii]|nr:hypothetical protein [Citrobacter braakii]
MSSNDMEFVDFEDQLDEIGRKHLRMLYKITPKLFSEYMRDKGVKPFCLQCGKAKLFTPHTIIHMADPDVDDYDEMDDIIYVTPKPAPNTPFRYHTATYETNCGNCGFISKFYVHHVVEWARAHGVLNNEFN